MRIIKQIIKFIIILSSISVGMANAFLWLEDNGDGTWDINDITVLVSCALNANCA